jgi:DNA-binding response OmpR family regulator
MTNRVLVIDDEENIRRMIRLALEASGYEVGEAADGLQGLEVYSDGSQWDAVLLDQRMPGLDGLEVLRRVKRRDQHATVVMITAYASVDLAVDAMKLGATDFVRKPMTPEILRGALQAALAKRDAETPRGTSESEVSAPRSAAIIPTITLNGFEILRTASEAKSTTDNVHRFIVKSPGGAENSVAVEVTPDVIAYVERMTRRQLPGRSSFWTMRAERFLGDYLWNEGKVPPTGRLTLGGIDQAELPVAARWSGE